MGQISGELKVRYPGGELTRQIVAGNGLIYGWTFSPIDIRYPRAKVLGTNWMIWFFLISSLVAIRYKR